MVRGKLTLVSSKLKAGENICFIFISTFLRSILIEHCITASLGSGILFQNISPMLPAYDALMHTMELDRRAWSEFPLGGTELQ